MIVFICIHVGVYAFVISIFVALIPGNSTFHSNCQCFSYICSRDGPSAIPCASSTGQSARAWCCVEYPLKSAASSPFPPPSYLIASVLMGSVRLNRNQLGGHEAFPWHLASHPLGSSSSFVLRSFIFKAPAGDLRHSGVSFLYSYDSASNSSPGPFLQPHTASRYLFGTGQLCVAKPQFSLAVSDNLLRSADSYYHRWGWK